ncbi:tetratricopeptide repeat protein [Pleionea sediminis]|uniref:tetratricopeptide repeat protein n=1 Tax=Pleionea sediminis TaxID=2569479 RepID=UPI001184D966|nr:hypothetical protein [Pleionea sediminis]
MFSIKAMKNVVFILTSLVLFAGCATSVKQVSKTKIIEKKPPKLSIDQPLFTKKPQLVNAESIFSLTKEQKEKYEIFKQDYLKDIKFKGKDKVINSRIRVDTPENLIVGAYLEKISENFSYKGKTLTARETLENLNGNCMSLAVLTTAFAKAKNIEISYQLVTEAPIYQKQNGVVIRGQHIKSKLYDPTFSPKPGTFTLTKPYVTIDYYPSLFSLGGRRVNDDQFLAIFYNNKAAESFIDNDIELAYWYTVEAMQYHYINEASLNMLALLYQKQGLNNEAERIYLFGIEHSDKKVELLGNYHSLLMKQNRQFAALRVEEKMRALNEPNPFDWIDTAYEALQEGKLSRAERYFLKAQKSAPYLHETYAGLAAIEFLKGDIRGSKKLFNKAIDMSYEQEIKEKYKNKILSLTMN